VGKTVERQEAARVSQVWQHSRGKINSSRRSLPLKVLTGSSQDLEEVEEWNEYGELKQQIGATLVAAPTPTASAANTPSKAPTTPLPVPSTASKAPSDMLSPSPLSKETSEQLDSSSLSPSKKEETPLTMAMRQAGAEAAKKAGEKKGSRSIAPASTKDMEATEVPMPAIETKIAKSVEEPGVLAETTAAKIPEKLAEEGAKRTSVDRIAGEGAKRTSMDKGTEFEGASEQEHVGLSKEATMLEARRASSITKMRSPLSEETAATSSTDLGATSLESEPRTHRGSSVSIAPKEEIEEIEKKNTIPEEDEDLDESNTEAAAEGSEAPSISVPGTAGALESSADNMMTAMTATDEGEVAVTKGVNPQEQDPKDPVGAGVSVGD
jgi:hypothetical protein